MSDGRRRAVFLDRDGVINRPVVRDGKPYPPAEPGDLEIVPGARETLAQLKRRGFLLIVVTNQPDVGRGLQSREKVEAMNRALRSALPLDDIMVCYHSDEDRCDCRKPLPGLMLKAAENYGIDLAHSFLIGDRWRDIDAGHNAGCKTVLIDYSYSERKPAGKPDATVSSLAEATDWISNHELSV